MKTLKSASRILAATAFVVAMASAAQATTLVVTPNANATSPGTNNVNSPFGANSTSNLYVMQVQYAASLFTGIEVGSQLTSVGFRLARGSTTNNRALVYDSFAIQLGSSTKAIGGLSRNFAENLGADTVLAQSGPLTIDRHALLADACTGRRCNPVVPVNSFYTIDLGSAYTYMGGDLLITFSSMLAAGTIGQIVALDAVDPYLVPTVSTVATSGSGSSFPTRGLPVNFTYAPILQFGFEPPLPAAVIPEPATWALMLIGFGALGTVMRRRTAVVAA